MYRRALEGNESAWGPEHTSALNTFNNLGVLYKKSRQDVGSRIHVLAS